MAEDPPERDVAGMLAAITNGDAKASDELLPLVYTELRRLAHRRMAGEPTGQSLQSADLVHEAYLRLVRAPHARWANRAHFFAAAATAMRRILVERARKRKEVKRGGGQTRVTLDENLSAKAQPREVDMLALDEALNRLEVRDKQMADVVMLRYFAGLSVEDAARALGVSPRTVNRDWNLAKAWLYEAVGRPARTGATAHDGET